MRRLIAPMLAVLAMLAGLLVAPAASAAEANAPAEATSTLEIDAALDAETAIGDSIQIADLSKFEAGNIISDEVFFDSSTMTEAEIQAFLEEMVPSCQSGYTCLKDWYDTSRSTTADAMCGAYSGGTRERASRIIYKVSQACGINPQVILATLQKEQGLVNHVWPSDWRYEIAMGQGCPDTAACDTRYYGFFNQVFGAAWQFKRYANPAGTSQYFTWYAPGKTWNILWNPNHSCGSSPVYVENQATANLYYYTPYQPNAAAIKAGYGTGDGCSSYGNRNFYQYFTDWFGSTQDSDVCAVPVGALGAYKTYVLMSDVTARTGPSTTCADDTESLDAGTVVTAMAVTAEKDWLKVHVDDRELWIPRDEVRYATAAETVCAMPDADSAKLTYVVTGDAVVGRVAPSAGCDTGSVDVAVGTVATAVAVTGERDWLKLSLPSGEFWVPRDQVRYATTEEAVCVAPVADPAKLSYVVLPGGSVGRVAPSDDCSSGAVSLPAGTSFTAKGVSADRDWLLFTSGSGADMWVPRSDVEYASRVDVCDLGDSVDSAKLTYVVTGDAVVGRVAPSAGCDTGSVDVAVGTVATAVAVTGERDWLKLSLPSGEFWVPRDQVRYATTEEANVG